MSRHALLLLAAGAVLCASCAEEAAPPAQTPPPPYVPPPPPDEAMTPDEMYSLHHLPVFDLTLDAAALDALWAEPKVYVHGVLRYGDTVVRDVGVRLKGSYTLTTLDHKPSFKIKFNAFVKGRRFIGLEGLMLHAMHQDASMLREHLGYRVFRAAGVPAPRTGYALVTVNGEPYGLYLNVEPYNDDFLARAFADPSGNLYEGESGDDLQKDPAGFDQDEGDDTSGDDIAHLAAAAVEDGGGIFEPGGLLDVEAFLSFAAVEAATGHFEGYQSPHSYYLYHAPASGRWSFLPWNLDQLFIRKTGPFDGRGYLFRKCIDDVPTCRIDYVLRALEVAELFEALDLRSEMDAALVLIDAAAHADPRMRFTAAQMEGAQKGLRTWVASRPQQLAAELDCLVGGADPDDDGDGFGACAHDCDDGDPAIHAGADELCDGVDNDCTGWADDTPACPCPSEVVEGRTYYFCEHPLRWTEARDYCKAAGNELARLDTASQNALVWAVARDIAHKSWAIGLNDRQEEDNYLWLDGTAPAFTAWADGEPAKLLAHYDCTFLQSSEPVWRERNCNERAAFICSAM